MGGNETKSTVYQSNLPQYAKPYYENLMDRSLSESFRPYQPYQGQRIAGISPETQTGLDQATTYAASGTPHLDQGVAATGQVINQTGDVYQQNAGVFDGAAAQQYMSPYMQDVVDKAKQDAVKNAMEEQAMRNADFARSGAFGGSRAAVQNQIAIGQTQSRLTDIDVQGRQNAFENAQQQFERDRAAGFNNRNINLSSLQLKGQAAGQLGEMQNLQDQMTLDRIKAQLGVGQTVEDYKQEGLDMAYNDFVNQRDLERQNLQFFSSLLQGVPVSANQNVTSTEPTNPLAGMLGSATGLQALYALSRQ